jgi:hypothetical protein
VTKVEYQPIPPSLLPAIESAIGFLNVWANGDMYTALAHDSHWLATCKAALDGIRSLPAPPTPAAPATASPPGR